jgi:hypothetical protein
MEPSETPVVALPPPIGTYGAPEPEKVRTAVASALSEYATKTGHRVRLAAIEYVPNDSAYYEMYYGHALALAEAISADQGRSTLPSVETRALPSPFRRLLLTDYYDGEKDGLAIDSQGSVYVFRMLDWDDQQHMRVFSLADTPGVHWKDFEEAFRSGLGDSESWVLPPSLPADAGTALQQMEAAARLIGVIASRRLTSEIAVWRPLNSLPETAPAQGWLAWLGLPLAAQSVEEAILGVIRDNGPIGWYGIEIRLRIPRSLFKDGYTLMTYLEEMIAAGSGVRTTVDGKERFVAADRHSEDSATANVGATLRRLRAAGLTPPDRVRGCSMQELASLESHLRARLPTTYREFLLALGHDGGAFMIGSDFCFDRLGDLQVEARELASKATEIPRSAFTFLMHQGYEFLFFNLGDSDDPEVLRCEEGGAPQPLGIPFTTWFQGAADDEIRIREASRAPVPKDSSIVRLIAALSLPERGWVETDTWDGDLCAVGIARSDDPRRVVYVSTWKKLSGRYYFECETPTGPGATDYEVKDRGEDVDFDSLLKGMERHLGGAGGTTSSRAAP